METSKRCFWARVCLGTHLDSLEIIWKHLKQIEKSLKSIVSACFPKNVFDMMLDSLEIILFSKDVTRAQIAPARALVLKSRVLRLSNLETRIKFWARALRTRALSTNE